MGTIVMHAGMPKAGSSSVQRWLEAHEVLVRQHGVELLRGRVDPESRAAKLERYERLGISSGMFIKAYIRGGHDVRLLDEMAVLLDGAVGDRTVLLTCEGFGNLLASGDEPFLAFLERLAGDHEVRVACYVRPQHSHLEAAWKQWGFRTGRLPSDYLSQIANRADHLGTLEIMEAHAPHVDFQMRPFRTDLLDGGNIVVDFAGRFLGIDELPPGSASWWANAGLPLDVANLLREAPNGVFNEGLGDDPRYKRLKRLVDSWTITDSTRARESRAVLHAYALQQFEPSNVQVIHQLGWATDHFIPPLDDEAHVLLDGRDPKLELVDQLWEPEANETERQLFLLALEAALVRRPRALDRWLPRPWARRINRTVARTRRSTRRTLTKVSRRGPRRASR